MIDACFSLFLVHDASFMFWSAAHHCLRHLFRSFSSCFSRICFLYIDRLGASGSLGLIVNKRLDLNTLPAFVAYLLGFRSPCLPSRILLSAFVHSILFRLCLSFLFVVRRRLIPASRHFPDRGLLRSKINKEN